METAALFPVDRAETDAVVFDAYGTLFDVHAAVMRQAGRIGDQARAFSDLWRTKQLEYSWVLSLAGRYENFWQLTERALDYAFARFPDIDRSLRTDLLDAYRSLDPYPDAGPALAALLKAGFKTAILSNGNRTMLADAVSAAGFGALLDATLSVEDAGIFKTAPATYALVEARLGVPPGRTLFVSSNRWDVAGATAFGFPCLWINRAGLPDEYEALPPVGRVTSLAAIAPRA